jgi:hypothetical protein
MYPEVPVWKKRQESYVGDPSKNTKFGGEIGEGRKGTPLHKSVCVHLQYVPEIYTQQNQMLSYGIYIWF